MQRLFQPSWITKIANRFTHIQPKMLYVSNDVYTPCYTRAWHLHEYISPSPSLVDMIEYEPINHELAIAALSDEEYWELISLCSDN